MINELNGKLVELNSEISKLLYQVNTLKQNPEAQSEYATKTIELSVSSIEHKILSLDNFFNSIRGKVAAVLNGIKLLIFLFGATCSGKTYTTEGNLKINIFFYCFLPPITKILYLLTDSF